LLTANSSDDTARQHMAILLLADALSLEEIYQIVTDEAVASEHALDLIEVGDLDQLALLLAANPRISSQGITGAFSANSYHTR
jgi:hypothetical protein